MENETDTKITLYWDGRIRQTWVTCRFTKSLQIQWNHVERLAYEGQKIRHHSSTTKNPTKTHWFPITLLTPRGMPAMESYPWNTGAVVIVIVNDMVEIRNNGKNLNSGKNENKKNGKINNGGRSGKYSRSEPLPLFCKSLAPSQLKKSPTDISDTRARDGRWRQNTSPYAAHTHIFLVARRVAQLFHISCFIHCTCLGSRLESSSQRLCRVLKTVRMLQLLHLMSRRNLLGLPEGRPIVPDGLDKESGIPCIDPGGGGWFGRVAAQSPFAKKDIQRVQRSLTAYNQRTGKYRTVRFGRDFPNCSMHNVPEILQKKEHFIAHVVCVLCCRPEQTEDRDTDLNNGRMITGKQKTQKEDSEEVNTRLYGAPITYWPTLSRIPMESWMYRKNIVGLSVNLLMWTALQHVQKEQGITTCSSWSSKKGRIHAICRNETIWNLQPDRLLFSDTRKE